MEDLLENTITGRLMSYLDPPPSSMANDPCGLAERIAALRPVLLRFAMCRVRNRGDADDLVSATLLAALEGASGFRGNSQLSTWLHGILKHKMLDLFELRSRHASRFIETDGHCEACAEEASLPTPPTADPAEMVHRRQFLEKLEHRLYALSPLQAAIFTEREILGDDMATITKRHGVSASNGWVLIHRARKNLRQAMLEDGFDLQSMSSVCHA